MAEGVDVGLVGVMVAVSEFVGVGVGEEGWGVTEAVGDDSNIRVGVTVGVSVGFIRGTKIKARRRIRPINEGIPYLRK